MLVAAANHVSYWDTAPWYDVAAWLILAFGLGLVGCRIFRWVPRWPCRMQKWGYLIGYSLTMYSVGRVGYTFDAVETADRIWEPIVYLSSLGAAIGFLGAASIGTKLVSNKRPS